jgi:AraC family transcriptional regulator of adaptative response/methylated-DNA-[protein]-cysteine methyltransferase
MINDTEETEKYYNIVCERDNSYAGTFFFGVKSTGVFCIPGCRARTPKKENTVFGKTASDMLDAGYRPCKLCKPTENAFSMPEEVQRAIELIHQSPYEKIKDYNLIENNIRPEKVRRWFKKNYGLTYHAYQRMLRINTAFEQLKKGKSVTNTAFDSGYDSLSGFNNAYKKLVGDSPGQQDNKLLYIQRFTTPLGPMFTIASDKGVCLLEFSNRKMLENSLIHIEKKYKAKMIYGENPHIKKLIREIKLYFQGKLKDFSIDLDLKYSIEQINYFDRLKLIKYGATTNYQTLAREMQIDIQSIKKLNGNNTIAIIIPCHRVIDESGELAGYGGGIERKKYLLELESTFLK